MFRSKEDNDMLSSMHRLMWELEQAIARGEQINKEIILALNGLKLAEEQTEKEIDKIIKNLLQSSENGGSLN